jgi:protein-L-isoaspartate(D-aspartate) O-methyltransferase
MEPPAARANQLMVDRLVSQGALWSPSLIGAFRQTPRHGFLDHVFQYQRRGERWREVDTRHLTAEVLRLIYSDRALITRLSTGAGLARVPISSSSQPSLMAQMLEDLRAGPGMRVLEVGAGTGYNAALLGHLANPGRVLSLDVDRRVLAEAQTHLRPFAERHVELRHADGRQPLVGEAPFDRIMVTAATPDVEPVWLEQLAVDGLLLAPLAVAPGLAFVLRGGVQGGVFEGRLMRPAYFMPLRSEGEFRTTAGEGLPPPPELRAVASPWSRWFDRRRSRAGWLGFVQALAFFGWLRGLTVSYLPAAADGQPAFGLSAPADGRTCWFALRHWHVTGESGRDLGTTLYRAFLDAGGPWPTEYRLRACPRGDQLPDAGRTSNHRQGPRCHQEWELAEPRDRPGWA